MRVAELAALTGTTVRTVRYYHHLGLLDVPDERAGWRDYDLSHVARLSRIRWLAQAGVPLEAVGRVLDDAAEGTGTGTEGDAAAGTDASTGVSSHLSPEDASQDAVVEDLSTALACAQERLAEVTRQRDMLVDLLERARRGCTVTPMTDRMVAFFERMEAQAPDERTRAAVRHDRHLTELACYSGLVPPEADVLFCEPDEDMDAETIQAYRRSVPEDGPQQVDAHARWLVGRLERSLTPEQLREMARSVDVSMVESVFRLVARADGGNARATQAVAQHLVETIERWRR